MYQLLSVTLLTRTQLKSVQQFDVKLSKEEHSNNYDQVQTCHAQNNRTDLDFILFKNHVGYSRFTFPINI